MEKTLYQKFFDILNELCDNSRAESKYFDQVNKIEKALQDIFNLLKGESFILEDDD